MRSPVLVSLLGLLLCAAALGPQETLHAQAPSAGPTLHGSILFVPAEPVGAERSQAVHDRVRAHLAALGHAPDLARRDILIVQTDAAGRPILPDRAATARGRGRGRPKDANAISFTFESPGNPWTPEDVAFLSGALADFYPQARRIYGPPAFDIVVNVRKDPTISFAGFYDLTANEMTLRGASTGMLDVLCHELFHAFRDDNMIAVTSYEEGMARAAEIEVFNRLPGYVHPFDEAHGYTYDVYYEALNRPVIGAWNGNLLDGYVAFLLRYQLAGYAWGKALIENDRFLERFNRLYYDRVAADPATQYTEPLLRAIAGKVQPHVEGTAFPTWYRRQHVLNTTPPLGFALYQRIDGFVIDALQHEPSGFVTMLAGTLIDWRVLGHDGTLLDSGSGLSEANGHLSYSPALPPDYTGRLEVRTSAFGPDGRFVEDVAYRPFISGPVGEAGVFGVATDRNEGTVVIAALDRPHGWFAAPLLNGVFSVPALETARGRFVVGLFRGWRLESIRVFTKDASRYLVVF